MNPTATIRRQRTPAPALRPGPLAPPSAALEQQSTSAGLVRVLPSHPNLPVSTELAPRKYRIHAGSTRLGARSQMKSCAQSAPRTPSAAPVRWTVSAGSLAGIGLGGGFARPKQDAHFPTYKAVAAAAEGLVFSGMWGVTLMVLDWWPAIPGAILSVITMAERRHRSTRVPCFPAALAKVDMNEPSLHSPSIPAPRNIYFAEKLIRGNFETSSCFVNLRIQI